MPAKPCTHSCWQGLCARDGQRAALGARPGDPQGHAGESPCPSHGPHSDRTWGMSSKISLAGTALSPNEGWEGDSGGGQGLCVTPHSHTGGGQDRPLGSDSWMELDGAVLTPNICRRSGSRNRKGMLETCNLLGCCLSVLSEECSCWLSVCAASSVCWGRHGCHQPLAPSPQQKCPPALHLALPALRNTLDPVVPRFWEVPHGYPSLLVSHLPPGG